MKFTEEQYQKIVEKHIGNSNYVDMVNDVIGYVSGIDKINYEEAILLALPTSREWAHEQFVEKEKKYVWRDKYTGYVIYKMLNDWSLSATALGEKHFTETELKNSPFKPEWFDKEEVE